MATTAESLSSTRVLIDLPTTEARFFVGAEGPTPLIEVEGEIDLTNDDALAVCLSVFDDGDAIVVDLSKLTYLDSRGISVLVGAHKRGVQLTVRGAHGSPRRVLELAGLDSVLTIEN